ncbi:MAG: glutamate--cysteine ligase [Gammaproteobacteria bacterium]|nr:glutamate--cysteine ligase [Gammaproteobacteria bacterium]
MPTASPAPVNKEFLAYLNNPLVVPELAAFNVELNADPRQLTADALTVMERDLAATWSACQEAAQHFNASLVMIGILPSVTQHQLSLRHMSGMVRYRALNEQVFLLRHGDPLHLHIEGNEVLSLTHHDVMLEAGTTSLQIHLQVPMAQAHHYMNIAKIVSAPMVAASANSPYLFGHDLWHETRVPLFEQAVEVGSPKQRRVTFGRGYISESLFECFQENLDNYPVLVPVNLTDSAEPFAHLRFHNGTIWRWNRPLIGVEQDPLHLRIEHRVVPAGPTVTDCIANAALFYGLMQYWVAADQPMTGQISFSTARSNFYHCARKGLDAEIRWSYGDNGSIRDLLLRELLPQSRDGLQQLGISPGDIDHYLGIMEQRIETGRNGAGWQHAWVSRHGRDMQALTLAYQERQESGMPVHEWPL